MPGFNWDPANPACQHTYSELCDPSTLNQLNAAVVSFADAGAIKVSALPYYPKYGALPVAIQGAAAQEARSFLLTSLDATNQKRNPNDTVATMLATLGGVFGSSTATITDLAAALDSILVF